MPLKDQVARELQAALKSGNKIRLETLRMLRSALMEKEIELKARERGLSGEEEFAVLMSSAKKRKESIEMFLKGNRADLVEQERSELLVIEEFLPKMMTVDEIENAVKRIAADIGVTGAGDFSKLMPAVMKDLKGKADGRLVQEIVRKSLGA